MEENILNGNFPNIHAVLISMGSELIYENYFSGTDAKNGVSIGEINCTPDYLHDVCSISKLVVTSCVGIAIEKGHIKSISQPIIDFFPQFINPSDKRKCGLAVGHLLTMTSGMVWNEPAHSNDPANSELLMLQSKDPIAFVLNSEVNVDPGTAWRYNGGNTQLLAEIIYLSTGLSIADYAQKHLFEPLKISRFEWVDCPALKRPAAASGLRLTAPDLLKLGQLYASSGVFNGQQVVPKTWVDESLASQIAKSDTESYGYAFWRWEDTINGQKTNFMAAPGNGDQRIYLDHRSGLVIAVLAGNYNKWDIENNSYKLLKDLVYPHFLGLSSSFVI